MTTVLSIDVADAYSHPRGDAENPAALCRAIAEIGRAAFDDAFGAAACELMAADHMTLIAFRERGLPVSVAVRGGVPEIHETTRLYCQGLYQRDPNLPLIMASERPSRLKVIHRRAADYSRHYWHRYLAAVNVTEKLVFTWRRDGLRIALNCYRRRPEEARPEDEVSRFARQAALLSSIATRHCELALPDPAPPALDHAALVTALGEARGVELTAREADVCRGILEGRTAEAIGLVLGIAPSSVVTFRRSLYRKLGVASQGELFAAALRCGLMPGTIAGARRH